MKVEYIVVFITVPDSKTANNIAKKLVEEKLAACVNIVKDINSIYYWKGNIENDDELLLIVKTRLEIFEKLTDFVKKIHPYTVPEVIALPIIAGSDSYLKWIDDTLYR
ncbi:MAG TPA: divalent-cation tolerance protein CutA [Persephonella sp.]|uniref:Periplasmic divalent cation tolerance protein n=1 Tax=Persephonella marina (strain DSM 14350 / EX-H1) TaxID=123214 RepID=C0QPE7_PERMH|nr:MULTISPECIES: divalent-cation tolerance protein CutA [Persephonella]ACO04167.1 periplasmic divalent cation tolerance protein [Persephonella marina EX-H1]HCB69842.1 divalent-cation tolerance protein CutA [Persephonella sp.]